MASDSEMVEYTDELTASGGDDHALCRALAGLLTALIDSGCALTAIDYNGGSNFGRVKFTVQGTAEQVAALDASTDEWADG